jgi:hypothetical protein
VAPCHRLPLSLDELLLQFRGLLDAHRTATAPARAGEGNLRCEGCLDCNRCRFCVQCVRCDDCSNCEQCHDCRACTKSKLCRGCARSGSLEMCEGCEDSQYLVLCVDCTNCSQCFACVGLKGEEFFVLNQRYSRKDYFPVVQALKKRLEEVIAAGQLLPELAAVGRGVWPPRGVIDASATEASEQPAEAAPDIDPWADGARPIRGPAREPETPGPAVSWVPRSETPDL